MSMEAQESPASNHETGSLTQPSPHESRFIGSSSGIYFINTVKRAFESAGYQHDGEHLPSAESTVGGEEDFETSIQDALPGIRGTQINIKSGSVRVQSIAQLGTLPPYDAARHYAIEYFKTWHPVLPYLSGPLFLKWLDALYQDTEIFDNLDSIYSDRQQLCHLIIIQCVLSIGAIVTSTVTSDRPPLPRHDLLSLCAAMADRHDILTLQTVLAAQTYCVSTLALRTASSLGGLLSKQVYHAGLHRCPHRYLQLSDEDRELRKRIMWSAYALDRHISQALGIPVSLTNSEIDVCIPGKSERHSECLQQSQTVRASGDNLKSSSVNREFVLSTFVEYANLVGRALELFHVSLHSRSEDPAKVLLLRSDVDKWFNSLPDVPRPTSEGSPAEEQTARFLPFFHVLYEQLVISVNRPALSLPRSSPEFQYGLQVTIRAAKRTIVAMEREPSLFWPGYLAAVWMSGLIISFACQIGSYSLGQGSQEIDRCLHLLRRMGQRWRSAQRCHTVLSTLLSDLQSPQRRTVTEAFGEDDLDDRNGRQAKQKTVHPNGTPNIDVYPAATPGLAPDPSVAPVTAPEQGGMPSTPTVNGYHQWDINDFFQDLTWNSLFDINNMGLDPDVQFYAG